MALFCSFLWPNRIPLCASLVVQTVKESACNEGDLGSIPGSGRHPGEKWQPTPVSPAWRILWTGEPSRLSPWGHKDSDTTEWFSHIYLSISHLSSSCGSAGKESVCNVGDLGLIPDLGISPRGRHDNPLHYSCLENPHGQRSLVGYSPWNYRESDTAQHSTAVTFAPHPEHFKCHWIIHFK